MSRSPSSGASARAASSSRSVATRRPGRHARECRRSAAAEPGCRVRQVPRHWSRPTRSAGRDRATTSTRSSSVPRPGPLTWMALHRIEARHGRPRGPVGRADPTSIQFGTPGVADRCAAPIRPDGAAPRAAGAGVRPAAVAGRRSRGPAAGWGTGGGAGAAYGRDRRLRCTAGSGVERRRLMGT